MRRVKVKICGITLKEQALEIASLAVDAMGFVLYPASPRYVNPETVGDILKELPPFLKTVGVFVDEVLEKLVEITRKTGLDLVQLNGNESPKYCNLLTLQGISWIKVFRIKDSLDEHAWSIYPSRYFLLDAWSVKDYGGTGKTFSWDLAAEASKNYQIILAGGINSDNIENAISQVKPYGIDVSSGVETAPGIKSIKKINQLLANIKAPNV